jgi:hypothetical protein
VTGAPHLFLLLNLLILVGAAGLLWTRARTQVETRRWMRYLHESHPSSVRVPVASDHRLG